MMHNNAAATPAVITTEDDLLINWVAEEDLIDSSIYHCDLRTLVLDHGLYVIRER